MSILGSLVQLDIPSSRSISKYIQGLEWKGRISESENERDFNLEFEILQNSQNDH
jgi:hypothetical protein